MKVRTLAALLAAAICVFPPLRAPAQDSPGAQIAAIELQSVSAFLAVSPETATFLGDYSHDGDWSDPSPAGITRTKQMLEAFESKVSAVDMTGATLDVNGGMAMY